MTVAKRYPISKAAFGRFLKAHPRYKFVRGSGRDCPIARAIRETTPVTKQKGSDVHGSRYVRAYPTVTYVGTETYTTPYWASEFMRNFDRYSGAANSALQIWKGLGNR